MNKEERIKQLESVHAETFELLESLIKRHCPVREMWDSYWDLKLRTADQIVFLLRGQ